MPDFFSVNAFGATNAQQLRPCGTLAVAQPTREGDDTGGLPTDSLPSYVDEHESAGGIYGEKSRRGQGVPMGGLEESPERRKRRAKARRREEDRWAAKSGPVETLVRDPVTGELHLKDVAGDAKPPRHEDATR